jgi:dimethylaniline monooxygenase (N-oxide forming)
MSKQVAIIGGGPSGITSAKHCSSFGLNPVVFEINALPGGLWIPGTKIWSSLHCNFTKYGMSFSDFPWPNDPSFLYAHRDQLKDYLLSYIRHFDLLKYFKLKCRVDSASQLDDLKWKVTWTDLVENVKHEQVFDYLIVACGFLSQPNIPNLRNKENFKGLVMHSNDYKNNDQRLKGKRVLVVGSSNSSVEIASDLVGHAKSVINLFRRPFWVTPKFVKRKSNQNKDIYVPRDFLFYTRKFTYSNESKYEKYSEILPEQVDKNICPPDLYIDANYNLPVNFGISEHYFRLVKEKKIETKRGEMKAFVSTGIQLEDDSLVEADVILYCTGYRLEIPFFSREILDKIEYDKDNYKNPIILYKHTFHPSLPNLAFVFLTRGLFFIGLELQSKWAALVFSGKKEHPKLEDMNKEIELNRLKRMNTHSSVQFPHGPYVELVDQLAKGIGVYPNYDDESEEVKSKFKNLLILPTDFTYNENKEYCLEKLENIKMLTYNGVNKDKFC